jgi:hypothetical protein
MARQEIVKGKAIWKTSAIRGGLRLTRDSGRVELNSSS